MFESTEADRTLLAELARIDQDLESLRATYRSLSYTDVTTRIEMKAILEQRVAEREAFLATEAMQLAQARVEFRKEIERVLPVGPNLILTLIEDLVGSLRSDEAVRVGSILREVACVGLNALADPTLNNTHAKILKARYDALLEVGLPKTLVHDILVAEASRPRPNISLPSISSPSKK